MQVRYVVNHQGENIGPLSFEEIELRFNQNDLYPTDYVFNTEEGKWLTMLEFIMVHGPKERVWMPALQTKGAESPTDDTVDYQRFKSGAPTIGWVEGDSPGEITRPAYPIIPDAALFGPVLPQTPESPIAHRELPTNLEEPPPLLPMAPKARTRKAKVPIASPPPPKPHAPPRLRAVPVVNAGKPARPPARLRPPAPPRPPAPLRRPAPLRPLSKPRLAAAARSSVALPRQIDTSATVAVEVKPSRATRLEMEVYGDARVGEEFEIVVRALSDNGTLDATFNETVELGCNQPLDGLAPLKFHSGVARTKVRLIRAGAHQFSLTLLEPEIPHATAKWPGFDLSH